ncbi:MAG: hypothetical protein JWN37_824 [Candidatus Nomurabacteria bacterium]|nr:hypothetical protein [Candidatus Nomurabacteria bacterium]
MSNVLKANEFFDINKLPPEKGLLLFGLSMNRLLNRQSPEKCFEDIRHISPSKVNKPLIGLNFIYSDFLYLYSDKPAPELKKTFMVEVIKHRNGMMNLLEKNALEFQLQHAFNYMVWNQLYVGTNNFNDLFEEIKRIYKKDELFQKYLEEDCQTFGREMKENQVNFFLEENLMCYLLSKGQVKLPNEFIENNQKWVLFCYPGRALKSHIYLHQINPFKLKWNENPYQDSYYDLESKQLIDFNRIDLETYKVK